MPSVRPPPSPCFVHAPPLRTVPRRPPASSPLHTSTPLRRPRTPLPPPLRATLSSSSSSSPADDDSSSSSSSSPSPPSAPPSTSTSPSSTKSPPTISSLNLTFNGQHPLPSIPALLLYSNDLRPRLDYLQPRERERVLAALEVATVAHAGQLRKSGDPYIIHPVAVAVILADLNMDRDCIIAGLLHDTVEDTAVTLADLHTLFGHDVAQIVEGETKLSKLSKTAVVDPSSHHHHHHHPYFEANNTTNNDVQADNLKNLFIAMTKDVRVVIVKLADRLHNMRTLTYMPAHKQRKISKETLEFFAPLAHRLGIRCIKAELEELSFKYLYPQDYTHIKKQIQDVLVKRYDFSTLQQSIRDVLQKDLLLYNMIQSIEIHGHIKDIYSIYKRMKLHNEHILNMLDIGTIVIVLHAPSNHYQACYHVLGKIHTMWKPLPKKLKDYIAFPKPNGYQSLHTTVLLGQQFNFLTMEIQIRTREMNRIAEHGIATQFSSPAVPFTHGQQQESSPSSTSTSTSTFTSTSTSSTFAPTTSTSFPASSSSSSSSSGAPCSASSTAHNEEWRKRTLSWLINIREYIHEFAAAPSKDLIDAVRRDLLGNRVFVLTPKGSIIDLPKDSTPIDVAYRIHSDVGNAMIGAKVNGKIVQLNYRLQNADVVHIISSKYAKGPNVQWVAYAKSRTARQKIRQRLRAAHRERLVAAGRRVILKQFETQRVYVGDIDANIDALVEHALPRLNEEARSMIRPMTSATDVYIEVAKAAGAGPPHLDRLVVSLVRDRWRFVSSPSPSTSSSPSSTSSPSSSPSPSPSSSHPSSPSSRVTHGLRRPLLAPCCQPVKGDEVYGVIMGVEKEGKETVILLHRKGCRHINHQQQQQQSSSSTSVVVKVRWATGPLPQPPRQLTTIRVRARDAPGLLAVVAGLLATQDAHVTQVAAKAHGAAALLAFEIAVRDTLHLRRVLRAMTECEHVVHATRVAPNEHPLPEDAAPFETQQEDVQMALVEKAGRMEAAHVEL